MYNYELDLDVRLECEIHLARLGLTWKSARVKKFLDRCCGRPGAMLADCDEIMLEALLTKLEAIPTPELLEVANG